MGWPLDMQQVVIAHHLLHDCYSHNAKKRNPSWNLLSFFFSLEMSRRLHFSCFWTFRENQQRTAVTDLSRNFFPMRAWQGSTRVTSKEKNIGDARVDHQSIDLKLDLWGLQWLTTSLRHWMSFSLTIVNLSLNSDLATRTMLLPK